MELQPVTQTNTAVLSPALKSCRNCGSPVGEDQRYCLGCGKRSEDKPVPFAAALAPAAVAAPVAAKSKGGITPALAAAIVCLSVLFLGTGVLIGRSGDSGSVQAAAPQVVTVGAGADAGTAASAAAGAGTAKKSAGSAAVAAAPKGAKVMDKSAIAAATACSTPAECAKKSAKLPKTIVSPGTPPPKDGKAPAGGATGQTFN